MNPNGGRDHWGPVFSCALAGGGISGGRVYGSSDKQGGYPATDKVEPHDYVAPLFHLVGINPTSTFQDREGREHKLTIGTPLHKLLGIAPATLDRCTCTGDPSRVPAFDENQMLFDSDFSGGGKLSPAEGAARPRGWKASPIATPDTSSSLAVQRLPGKLQIGFGLEGALPINIAKGATALLAQEVRSPFAGTYKVAITACGFAPDKDFYEANFLKHFSCKLLFFQYTEAAKKATARKEHISIPFIPQFTPEGTPRMDRFELTKEFLNPTPGSNFSFGLGLGVAILIEKTSDGPLTLPAGKSAGVRLGSVELSFTGKVRNEDVKV